MLHLQLWHFDAVLKRRRPSHHFYMIIESYVTKTAA